jgi:hypothetical protein
MDIYSMAQQRKCCIMVQTDKRRNDAVIAKVGFDGSWKWGKMYHNQDMFSSIYDACPTSDGGVFLVGQGTPSYVNIVWKIDASGNVLWSQYMTSTASAEDGNDVYSSTCVVSEDAYYAIGGQEAYPQSHTFASR